MANLIAIGFLSLLLGWGSLADADTCASASSRGRVQRDAHKWLEARDQFLICARQDCPSVVRGDCAVGLEQAQAHVATIVPIATDEAGNSVPDVSVWIDGRVLAEKIDGRAVEVNPGSHSFTFVAANGAQTERHVVVAEGEKGKSIVATLPAPSSSPRAGARETSSLGALKAIGIGAAGAGLVGLALGSVFGLEASSEKHSADCNANDVCPNQSALGTLDRAQNDGNLSTTAFGIGAILLASGIAMWVLAPGGGVQVTPGAGASAAGVLLRGTW